MRIPLLLTLQELDQEPRKFLYFTCFNVISWQCIAGSALVLFARRIDMPPSLVGFLISFMPLSQMLVLLTFPLVTRLGAKRLMMWTWFLRNVAACMVFVMPLAIAHWGARAAWYVLFASTLGFCFIRAAGSGGWLPWLHEVVPSHQRATFFSGEAALSQFMSVVVTLALALILHGNPGIGRFLMVSAIGIAAGVISVGWMARVPGGGVVEDKASMHGSLEAYRRALSDRDFTRFLLLACGCFSAASWLGSVVVLYLRDGLGYSPGNIMVLSSIGSAGVFLTIRAWARFAEHSGSSRTMYKGLFAHGIGALFFLLLAPGASWTPWLAVAAQVSTSVFGTVYAVAANRAMLGHVQIEGRVAYTNLWSFGTSLSLGITPIFAGQLIELYGLWGFRICFLIAAAGSIGGAFAWLRVATPAGAVEPRWGQFINPALPVRTMARILWITVGMHESNRDEPRQQAVK